MGQFLDGCIQSVLHQDYPYVEHIIHDGKSTDNTQAILKKYRKQKYINRIKISSQKDIGQSDGLNKAIQQAKGDYLLILNADDELLPYACAWAITNFSLFPDYAVIYGDVYLIDKNGKLIKIATSDQYDLKKLFCVELVPPAQAAFIQTKYFKKVGFYADKNLDTCPDFEMWIRIASKFSMKHIPGVISKYRAYSHNDSHAQRYAMRFYKAKKIVIDKALNRYTKYKMIPFLKYKAYSGLSFWTAQQAINEKNLLALKMLIQSVLHYPSLVNIKRVINIFMDSPLLTLKLLFNK